MKQGEGKLVLEVSWFSPLIDEARRLHLRPDYVRIFEGWCSRGGATLQRKTKILWF
jgi:hypothetical protein